MVINNKDDDSCDDEDDDDDNDDDDENDEREIPSPRLNINQNKRGPTLDPSKIKVSVQAYIQEKIVSVDETSNIFVKYTSPSFKAKALVEVPRLGLGEFWTIGWIQGCATMKFINVYGDNGMSSWEFPELNRGQKILSDSDGEHLPWYGGRHETQMLWGPTNDDTFFNIKMSDSFSPQVTWVPPDGSRYIIGQCSLTEIHRDQSFFCWVVARNEETREMFPLKTVKWRVVIDIKVDRKRSCGQRCKVIGPVKQLQPEIIEDPPKSIPRDVLVPPHANVAQMLVWRPFHGKPVVIIGPKWTGAPPITKDDLKNPFL